MSDRVRVVLAVEDNLPESIRVELDASLEAAGWFAASDDFTCWVCKAKSDQMDEIEHRVRKMMEFAAFNAGVDGRLPFCLKVGEGAPKVSAVRIGSGGEKTKPVVARNSHTDFATERVPNGGAAQLPSTLSLPTQLKTAF